MIQTAGFSEKSISDPAKKEGITMIIIAAVDDRNGMMFNHRRQSQDKVLREKILSLTTGKLLWMDHYSAKQFDGCTAPQLNIDDRFMWEAAPGEYCFVEDVSVAHFEKWAEQIILFKWNRKYTGDFYFDIDVQKPEWKLIRTEDFTGSSHEKITMEVYDHA